MSNSEERNQRLRIVETPESTEVKETEASASGMSGDRPQKRSGRRPGRRSVKMDVRAKLERSRQSARECRARKKLRYQYLEDLVANREKAVFALREELEMYKNWCSQLDMGLVPLTLLKITDEIDKSEKQAANQKEDKSSREAVLTNQIQEDTAHSEGVDQSSSSSSKANKAHNSTSTNFHSKGSNSNLRFLTKEDNSAEDLVVIDDEDDDDDDDELCTSVNVGASSSADLDPWDFEIEDGYVKILPFTKYTNSTNRASSSKLPTIVEEKEA